MRELVIGPVRHAPAPAPAPSAAAARAEFAHDVRRGLLGRPKQLQAKYFYDPLGSQLFEAICHLPWYRITRAERRLLVRFADAMVEPLRDLATIIELGCGNGAKIATLAEGVCRRGGAPRVHLIDISPTALELSVRALARVPNVAVTPHRSSYDAGLRTATASRPLRGATLVLFLGSNIGNFHPVEAAAFLRDLRRMLRPGDALLLGADLVKPESELLLAYDDPLGVTAAFNKNLLVRINRELEGDFELQAFDHRALWNAGASRVEMHLVSRRAQPVRIAAADLSVPFAAGETIWTESSYKYSPGSIAELGGIAGFSCHQQWIEPEARFAVSLLLVR